MSDTLRIDKWMWFARVCKTRSLAQTLVLDGRVSINDEKICKSNRLVRVADTVAIVIGPTLRILTVKALGVRRGPAVEAAQLYKEHNPPKRLDMEKRDVPFHRPAGAGRPTKRDRRLLDKLFQNAGSN